METQVISAKQLKKTLSAKAAAKKAVKSRNVLAWPKHVQYWPVLDREANNELKTLLESLLAPAKLPCCSLPLQVAKTVKGIERKEMRQKLYASEETVSCKMLRAKLLLGMNSVVRGITGSKAAVVVVAGDNNQEQRLGKLVIDMCVQRDVPVVVVATLQEATRQCLGFGCLAVGVKKGASDGHFGPLVERVRELSATSIQGHKCSPIKTEKETGNFSLEIPVKQEIISDVVQGGATSVYKYRSSKKQRAFVLEDESKGELASWLAEEAKREFVPCIKAEHVERKPKVDFANQDFISFGDDECVTPVEVKESRDAGGAGVKEEAKLKRKANNGNQDFISFGDPPALGGVEPKPKRKADAAFGQGDSIALVSPANPALEAAVSKESSETFASRSKLPKYRPLIVKSIQPNPTKKKKKKKKSEGAN